jgi:hypothetical protein
MNHTKYLKMQTTSPVGKQVNQGPMLPTTDFSPQFAGLSYLVKNLQVNSQIYISLCCEIIDNIGPWGQFLVRMALNAFHVTQLFPIFSGNKLGRLQKKVFYVEFCGLLR